MPKKFKNVSPLGALDLPALGQVVEPGEVFSVPDDLVAYFEGQSANFEAVVPKPPRKPTAAKAAAQKADTKAVASSSSDESGEPAIGGTETEGN